MSEPTHTPAPWHASAGLFAGVQPFWDVYDAENRILANVVTYNLPSEQSVANVALIVAAPELLEAAKLMTNLFEEYFEGMPDYDDELIKIRAAIAKAEGRT